jgi:hypothetical protein
VWYRDCLSAYRPAIHPTHAGSFKAKLTGELLNALTLADRGMHRLKPDYCGRIQGFWPRYQTLLFEYNCCGKKT